MSAEEAKEIVDAIAAEKAPEVIIEKHPAANSEKSNPSQNGDKDGGSNTETSKPDLTLPNQTDIQAKEIAQNTTSDENDSVTANEDSVDLVAEDANEAHKFKVEVKEEIIESESDNKSMDSIKDDYNSNHNLELNKEELGKGRRARVPNKRYSDILSPRLAVEMPPIKMRRIAVNGDTIFNELADQLQPETPINRKKKNIDMRDPKFLKPLDCGWKRELVFRAQSEYGIKRAGDIYYYSPKGKKVRSMRELSECLDDTRLSLDDFTFYKESLGIDDPDREIIRDAKHRSANFETSGNTKKKSKSKKHALPIISSKAKPSAKSGFKVKLPSGKSKSGGKKPKYYEDDDDGAEWETTPISTKKESSSLGTKPCQPCSIRCLGALGMIPTLQCRLCLCLYHNQCMGIAPTANIAAYVCKNCLLFDDSHLTSKQCAQSQTAPPPLTPKLVIPKSASVASLGTSATQSTTSQSLSNIAISATVTTTPSTPNKPTQTDQLNTLAAHAKPFAHDETVKLPENTWYASAIAANRKNRLQRPQFVEHIGNKKFIVIPRNDVTSIDADVVATGADFVQSADKPVAASLGPSCADAVRLINDCDDIIGNNNNPAGGEDDEENRAAMSIGDANRTIVAGQLTDFDITMDVERVEDITMDEL